MDLIQIGSLIVGPLVGVLAAYQINEWRRENLDRDRKKFFNNLLFEEISKSIILLKANKTNLIPIDGWNSLVNSGDVALFKDQAIQFSDVYFKIQMHNYEATRTRDALEAEISIPKFKQDLDVSLGPLKANLKLEQIFPRFSELKCNLLTTSDKLLEDLEALKELLAAVDTDSSYPGYNDPRYEEIKKELSLDKK